MMNKQLIEQLAEQSYVEVPHERDWDATVKIFDKEKFARLIIQECMTIADLPNSADGKYDAFLPSEMIAKHFGSNDAMES